jgi:beta-1,4-mannosyltransferase
VRVLFSFGDPRHTANPYTFLLSRAVAEEGVRPLYFTWFTAFFRAYDVFHMHWPHSLVQDRGAFKARAKRSLFAALLLLLRVRRIPVIWTIHNLDPHEAAKPSEVRLLARFAASVDHRVLLHTPEREERDAATVILHGHYRDYYQFGRAVPDPAVTSFALPGMIRPYKNIEELIEAFLSLDSSSNTLVIAGKPAFPEYLTRLVDQARSAEEIEVVGRRLSDVELVDVVEAADVIVLPYREIFNSGVALLALSASRVLLARDSPSMRELAREFPGWVFLFSGQLSSESLAQAGAAAKVRAGEQLDMASRDWGLAGQAHRALYLSVLSDVTLR